MLLPLFLALKHYLVDHTIKTDNAQTAVKQRVKELN
jgi:hypothetical protein